MCGCFNILSIQMAGANKTRCHGAGIESKTKGTSGDGKEAAAACKKNGLLGEGKTAGGSTTDRGSLPETPTGREDPA
jgi:hypothetical protein